MDTSLVRQSLLSIIDNSLYGPGGDPNREQLLVAADAFMALREIDPNFIDLSAFRVLKRDNLYGEDFLPEIIEPINEGGA
jgi:hypothetical protein